MRTPLGFRRFGKLALAVQIAMLAQPNQAPVASNVTFTGTLSIGSTLTGDYDFSDPNGSAESGTTYQWYRADDDSGTNAAAISGATNLTYVVQSADMNKYLRFGVTPSDGELTGSEAFSAWQQAWITNPLWGNTVLLLHFDGTDGATSFTDSSASNHSLTKEGSGTFELDTAFKVFGASSLLKSINNRLLVGGTLSDFAFGTGDFAIEGRARFTSGSGNETLITIGDYTTAAGIIVYREGATGRMVLYHNGAEGISVGGNQFPADSNFRAFALSRVGTSWRMFKDGTQIGSTYTSSANITTPAAVRLFGSDAVGNIVGSLDEWRILKGAGYSGNYTPRASAFPEQYMAP